MNNTRRNVVLHANGKAMSVTEWARELGVNYDALRARIRKLWTHDRAINTPFKVYRKRKV